jgi:steroid delta-isomerase-like uncharacterized protein
MLKTMKKRTAQLFFCISLVVLGIGCNTQKPNIEKNKTIAKEFIEAWDNHDSIKVTSLYSDNFIYQDMAFGFKISGNKNELKSFVDGTIKGAPDLHFKINSVIASDSMAAAEWTWTGTFTGGWGDDYPANNKPFIIQGVSIMKIENGLIKRSSDYYDNNPFRKTIEVK